MSALRGEVLTDTVISPDRKMGGKASDREVVENAAAMLREFHDMHKMLDVLVTARKLEDMIGAERFAHVEARDQRVLAAARKKATEG